jgi:hypothetical protein
MVRRMRRRRWLLLGSLVVVGAILYLVVVQPRLWRAQAAEWMAVDPCVRGQGPPGDAFFEAVPLAFRASRYPGVDRDRTDADQSRCVATFAEHCGRRRYEAQTRASQDRRGAREARDDWRKIDPEGHRQFCTSWRHFMEFLDRAGASWPALCEYCAPAKSPA